MSPKSCVQEQRASEEEERFHEEDPVDLKRLFGCLPLLSRLQPWGYWQRENGMNLCIDFFSREFFTDNLFELRLVSQDAFWLFREFG